MSRTRITGNLFYQYLRLPDADSGSNDTNACIMFTQSLFSMMRSTSWYKLPLEVKGTRSYIVHALVSRVCSSHTLCCAYRCQLSQGELTYQLKPFFLLSMMSWDIIVETLSLCGRKGVQDIQHSMFLECIPEPDFGLFWIFFSKFAIKAAAFLSIIRTPLVEFTTCTNTWRSRPFWTCGLEPTWMWAFCTNL